MSNLTIKIGGTARDDGAAFVAAWHRAEAGDLRPERILTFESWDALAALMNADRLALLRHLRAHSTESIPSLATAMGRSTQSLENDLIELERAGLVTSSETGIQVAGDRIEALIELV